MYDVIIIGAGPAGLTAAIYARRASKKVLVLEAKTYGGQIINTLDIENYPVEEHISGVDFATKLYKQAENLGAEVAFEKVVSVKLVGKEKEVTTEDDIYKTKTVIIATGSDDRKLGLSNEEELIGKGISYCATCDGAFYKGKKVAVNGGGNTALEDALYLADVADKVYLIHRRDEFRGAEATVERLKEKGNVELVLSSKVTELNADGKLKSIEVTNSDDEKHVIEIDGLFVAIGRMPATGIFEGQVEMNKDGYIVAGEDCHTSTVGVFVAGDNRTKEVRQLVTAVADGAVAATEAVKYLSEQ